MKTALAALAIAASAYVVLTMPGGMSMLSGDNADIASGGDDTGNNLGDEMINALGTAAAIGVGPFEMTNNRKAFLDMTAMSEGTYGQGDDGYNKLVNPGGYFASYADHPRQVIHVGGSLYSTAAGRYQILARTWDGVKGAINAGDFSPGNQDAACLELARRRGALADIDAGDIETAVLKCNREWASFTGSPYNQNPHDMGTMLTWFEQAGGTLA
jgi:muramidase (phage lysozyme)